jgi:hypothetical protein
MEALAYNLKYAVSDTQYNIDPYNKGDFGNGWPDNIGVPTYLTDDLGLSLRSRFSLPAAPWSGDDNAMLDIFLRYGNVTNMGQESFDPPDGYIFIGAPFPGDPWRRWESSYEYVVLGGPYMWDRYTYRASGIYVQPYNRHIITTTVLKGAGVNMIPMVAVLSLLFFSVLGSSATTAASGRRRKK